MSRGRPLAAFVVAGFALALALAVLVVPHSSSSPDGLQKVAAEQHLDDGASASTGGRYDDFVDKGVGGAIGVIVTFGAAVGVSKLIRSARSRRASPPTTV